MSCKELLLDVLHELMFAGVNIRTAQLQIRAVSSYDGTLHPLPCGRNGEILRATCTYNITNTFQAPQQLLCHGVGE